jgi:hypothetical protein
MPLLSCGEPDLFRSRRIAKFRLVGEVPINEMGEGEFGRFRQPVIRLVVARLEEHIGGAGTGIKLIPLHPLPRVAATPRRWGPTDWRCR